MKTSPLLTMESRWNSFRKKVQGFLKSHPYQRDAIPSPAVVIHQPPVPLTGASLTAFSEELCLLRQELSEQDSLIAECDISHDAIHDITRRLNAVGSTPPPYGFQDTWYLRKCRDAELREIQDLIVKMQGLVVKVKPLTQRRRVLSKQILEWERAVRRMERAEEEQRAMETVEAEDAEEADSDQEDIDE